MYKIIWACYLIFIAVITDVSAQTGQYAYQVNFTDKNNTPYSLTSPGAYLSARSIARRTTQAIAIDSTDIPVNHTYIDSVLQLTNGILHESSKWQNLCVVLITDTMSIHTLDGKPYIKSYKQVGYYASALHHKSNKKTPPATYISHNAQKTTGDAGYYNNTWAQTAIINGYYLNDMGYKGAGKLIAVLDAGFIEADTHPGFDSLRNAGRLIDVHNFSYDTDYVYTDDYHGAEVLSTMAAYVPNTFVGAAPLAMYALYITEIGTSEQPLELVNLLCGIERADSVGADILTCSLGYNTFDNPLYNFNFSTDFDGKTTIAAKAVNMATQKGMLFVASAGNEGGDSWNMILTPGDADSALTIGSVTPTGVIAYNSGYGPNAAGQIKPDVCAMGQPANVIYGTYTQNSGTSFATPQIAGWAACLWEANPTATPYQLKNAIRQCASLYNSPNSHYGYGIANFMCTTWLLSKIDSPPIGTNANWVATLPNPFNDNIDVVINTTADQHIDFELMDITGRIILHFEANITISNNQPISINTKYLPKGIYLLKAVAATQQMVIKVVKG